MRSLVLTFVLIFTCASLAEAHAFLDHANPKVGSVVVAPSKVQLWFTEELEGAFSKIKVLDAAGHQVDGKDAKVDAADKSLLTVSVAKLPPGNYKVEWIAVAVDSHRTTGNFTFTVKNP